MPCGPIASIYSQGRDALWTNNIKSQPGQGCPVDQIEYVGPQAIPGLAVCFFIVCFLCQKTMVDDNRNKLAQTNLDPLDNSMR